MQKISHTVGCAKLPSELGKKTAFSWQYTEEKEGE